MNKIIQSVPNFSEGRDLQKIEQIVDVFRARENIKLLNYSSDRDHNRMVVTIVGEPQAVKNAVIEAIGKAVELLDLTTHSGEHPRVGVADVVPFVPIKNVTMEETIALSKEIGKIIAEKYNLPVFLYEKSASASHRENLANIRRGGFEGLSEKMKLSEWQPDFGTDKPHPTAGVSVIGARIPLIAYNINLNTNNIEIANAIAKKIRFSNGGLRHCKAIGVNLKEKGIVQVSTNLTDYTQTPMHQVFELVKIEAKRCGTTIAESEIIGLVPLEAVVDTASYYLGIKNFDKNRILDFKT